ncbi:MAG TPA: thioredoxin [Candidatus Gracilibacteria bacterium]|nr:thioredoxin [Candidatus Gracilibacteria bacterium]
MQQISQSEFATEVEQFNGIVLADFYADWCGPCRMLSPMLEKLSAENTDSQIKFIKINVDQNQELAGKFGVMSIPTVAFFKNGQFVGEQVGVAPVDFYKQALEQIKNHKE